MKRGRLPLTALRSFEVAGRLQSFTQAAAELFISQAAISRQVRELEKQLGQALFVRKHRGVALTADGKRLLAVLTRCFDEIDVSLEAMRASKAAVTVAISCEPSFAACWLTPNLAGFQSEHPDIDVILDSDSRVIEFRGNPTSLAIRYSATASHWPRSESRHLADVEVFPVAAPALLEQGAPVRQPADLARHTLLHEENRDLWHAWFERAGANLANAARGPVFADDGLVLQAVVRGQGVALLDARFVADDIRAGRLVRLFDAPPLAHGAYWLVARRFDALAGPVAAFVRWIDARMRAK